MSTPWHLKVVVEGHVTPPPPLTLLEGGVNVESWNWDRGRTQRLPRSKLPAIFPDVERTKGGANRFVMEEPVPEPSLL